MAPILLGNWSYFAHMFPWAIGPIIATVELLIRLANQYLDDESKLEKNLVVSLVWDILNGAAMKQETGYRPHQYAYAASLGLICCL